MEAEVASRRDVSETTAQIDEVLRLSAERVGGGGQARAAAASVARLHREDESLWRDAARHEEESPPPSRSARHAAAVRGGADPGSPVLHPKCFWRDSLSASEEDEEEIDDDERFAERRQRLAALPDSEDDDEALPGNHDEMCVATGGPAWDSWWRREHPDWVKECHNCSCRRCRARGVWYMPTHMSPGTERPRSPPKPRDARPWSPVFPHRDEQF